MDNRVFESAAERTFQYQSALPPLPVPGLEDSLSKYLDAGCWQCLKVFALNLACLSLMVWFAFVVKPFSTEEEFRRTSVLVKEFGEGMGKDLHQTLLQRAKGKRNWLEKWWLSSAYLEVRMPSQLNVNFGGPAPYLEHCWPAAEGTQLPRTSLVVWHTLQYWDLIRTERLAVHKAGNTPLDMDQFRMLYCTCKVPGIATDTIHNYFRTESEGDCPSHVVVFCRGRVFTFDGVRDGRILTPPEILRQLTHIREACEREPEGPGVAALTTEEAREYLIALDPQNRATLETIQSSLFVISLDEARPYSTPDNYTNVTLQALTGDPTVRWGDKSYNILCFADGTFGSNCDHAPYDAMVLVSMCFYIDQKLKASGGQWKGSEAVRDVPRPQELVFKVDTKVREDIALAKLQYRQSAQDLQLVSYAFTAFGKAAIKKKRFHPDTFVQLALQLAYFRLHRRPGSCYETATTRRFYHGRTETMRPCTVEALEWCLAMLDPSLPAEKKRQRLMAAASKHNRLMSEAQNGKGFDRHLLGLYLIAKEHGLPVPKLYQDPAFSKSGGGGNFVLSTSLVGYTTVLGAVVPMVRHGYGFFYRIRDDR
ncbi:OCTC octanoyltransferase, partial [Amia calva]|nr:OCTC octanoyltransferase [Amia calva]